jgi:spermidine synthase
MGALNKVLEKKKSKINGEITVVKTLGLGICIRVDGLTQSGGIVRSLWKDVLKKVHNSYPIIHNSLVLGLGGGTVAGVIRKYYPSAKITGVDIDPVMVELGTKYLALGKSDVEIVITDAYKLVNDYALCTMSYDLILVDLYNGYNYPKKFETLRFLASTRTLLSETGVIIFNHLYSEGKRKEAIVFGQKLEKVFSRVEWYYPLANVMFICSTCKRTNL